MLRKWYRKWIGRFVFRKLNLGIGFSSDRFFLTSDSLHYSSFFQLCWKTWRDVARYKDHSLIKIMSPTMITQFKRETISFYPLANRHLALTLDFIADRIPLQRTTSRPQNAIIFPGAILSAGTQPGRLKLGLCTERPTDSSITNVAILCLSALDPTFDFKGFFCFLSAELSLSLYR